MRPPSFGTGGPESEARNRQVGAGQGPAPAAPRTVGSHRPREARDRKGVKAVSNFKYPALKELTDQQVRFAPPARRLEQMKRAHRLLAELDPTRQYPYQF